MLLESRCARSAFRVQAWQTSTQGNDGAVARYHFNIRNGNGFTADDEGMEMSSDQDARSHAIDGARSLMSAEVLQGTLDLNGQIEITDEAKDAVMTVRFTEAVDLRPATSSAGSPL